MPSPVGPGRRPAAAGRASALVGAAFTLTLALVAVPALAATSGRFPSTNAVVDSMTAFNNPTLAYADDANYADTLLNSGNRNWGVDYGAFGFDATIPADAVINTVTLEVKWQTVDAKEGNDSGTWSAQAVIDGELSGSPITDATNSSVAVLRTSTNLGITSPIKKATIKFFEDLAEKKVPTMDLLFLAGIFLDIRKGLAAAEDTLRKLAEENATKTQD